MTVTEHKTQGKVDCPECTPKPIRHGTGQKYKEELIVDTPTLKLVLSYNSTPVNHLPFIEYNFGKAWSFNYGMRVWITQGDAAGTLRPDGKMLQFLPPTSGNTYVAEADVPDKLEKLVSGSTIIGWKFTTADDTVENYDAGGKLASIVERNGRTTTLAYSTVSTLASVASKAGLLIQVTDHFARSLNLYYDFQARVIKATDPLAKVYTFAYDEATSVVLAGQQAGQNLTSVKFPDLHTRLYHYNEQNNTGSVNLPNALTGITDENNMRFATYQYDSLSRAVSSELAGGVSKHSVAYNADGSSIVTDPLNTARTYTYQSVLGVPHTTGISGSACPSCGPASATYDINGFAASRTDWKGNITTYTRLDPYGRLDLETSRTEASGSAVARTITTQWHATFRLRALITEPNRTTAFTYDSAGNMLTKTVTDVAAGRSRVWTYTYSAIGQVLTVNGPRIDVTDLTTYAYYANTDVNFGKRGNVATIANALSHVTTVNTYDTNGRPLTITDPNASVTTLTWHPRGWLASRAVGTLTTTYTYDFAGQLTKVTLPDAAFLQYTYDNAHRLTQIQDNLGNKIVYTLDNMSNRTKEEVKDPASVLKQTRSRVFNSLSQLYQNIGGTTPATQITQYGYDNQGNLATVTDPLNHVTTNAFDALNRLIQVTDPLLGVTQYALNNKDQLTGVTDPRNNATTYSVDALDNINNQVSPDTGTTTNTYNAAGNVLTSQDAKGQTTTYTYDALNRVTLATYHDASSAVYAYDTGTAGKGRLVSITEKNPAGTMVTKVVYTYDAKGRLLTDTRTIGGVNYAVSYAYNATTGRLTSMTYPGANVLAYTYDSVGQITKITWTPSGAAAQTVASSITYHPFGGMKALTFGNAQTYSRTFDLDGRIAGFTLAGIAQTVSFDAASRVTGSTYFPNAAQSVTYGYDNLDRLNYTLTPATNYGFTYDTNGNRTTKTVGTGTKTYTYPATNNKLSNVTGGGSWTYTHDADGSITADNINTYTYDIRGRLISSTTALGAVTYQVNAMGQRYRKTLAGVTTAYVYDKAGHLIAETSNAGTNYTHYLWLNDTPLAIKKIGVATLYYIHNDHLDTPRLIANQAKATVWRWDNSDPFGANMANDNPGGLGVFNFNLRYPGQYFDKETNNHYNTYRDYSPEIGRYVESDPIGLRGGLNAYTYVDSDPLSWADPLGLAKFCCRLLNSFAGSKFRQRHCYVVADDGTVYGLYPTDFAGNSVGLPRTNDPRDTEGECFDCPALKCDQNKCLADASNAYPTAGYSTLGTNSNTYAGTLARSCCKGGVPTGVSNAPGITNRQPKPSKTNPRLAPNG